MTELLGSVVSKDGEDNLLFLSLFLVYCTVFDLLLITITKMTNITKVTPAAISTTLTQKFDGALC